MGFDGLVVGDWNGHEQIEGCSKSSCAEAINAGVDLIMVPEDWKAFQSNTVKQVKSGEITEARIDDAVRRILRVKYRAGMFDSGKPSAHRLAGRATLIGHADHRNVARQAVRESLVLLKNDGVLPIDPSKTILVTGSGSDNPIMQSGGWTVTWQGRSIEDRTLNPRSYYKGHTTIANGISEAVKAAKGDFTTDENASKIYAAIVVFGEQPYAEFEGDLESLDFDLSNQQDFKIVQDLKAKGIPVVTVFISGRPRGVDAAIEASDAFVAAWLPGSEGAGVAEVLLSGENGKPAFDFKGKLPFAWPQTGQDLSASTAKYNRGYGLTYSQAR